jgi:hypothetical protein
MKDTNKQRARTIKACPAAILISAGMLLAGCSRHLPGTEKSWTVGGCEILEEIRRSKSDWPDATFLRTYQFKRDGRKLAVGSYENESSTGVHNSPLAVGEYIVIPTSCYVYRVGPDNQVNEFSPWKANLWHGFSEPLGINGHYDYHADTVEEVNGVWRLTYALERGLDGDRPEFIHFVTKDNWQSFRVETEEREQAE